MLKVMLLCICTPAFASSSTVLPETGGAGTTGFIVGGTVLIAAASAAAALTLISCDPPVLEIKDNSALERITLEVSNDNNKWEYGEERIFTIVPYPNTAIVNSYSLRFSNPDIVELRQGDLPNQFKVMAAGEGKLIITASAIGHGEVPGQQGTDWTVEKTETAEFNLQDNRVKPKRPVVSLKMAPTTDILDACRGA